MIPSALHVRLLKDVWLLRWCEDRRGEKMNLLDRHILYGVGSKKKKGDGNLQLVRRHVRIGLPLGGGVGQEGEAKIFLIALCFLATRCRMHIRNHPLSRYP